MIAKWRFREITIRLIREFAIRMHAPTTENRWAVTDNSFPARYPRMENALDDRSEI